MTFLTNEERLQLRFQHKRERDKRICDRIKAVLLHDKGWSISTIAEALLLSDDAILQHISEYQDSKKLKPENGGSIEKLSLQQSVLLEEHLQRHTYLYVKDIVAYVLTRFDVVYTIHGLRNWLQRHRFSYKKPAIVPGKANKQQQEEWLAEYAKLSQNLPEDETICFMDGASIPLIMYSPLMAGLKSAIAKKYLPIPAV